MYGLSIALQIWENTLLNHIHLRFSRNRPLGELKLDCLHACDLSVRSSLSWVANWVIHYSSSAVAAVSEYIQVHIISGPMAKVESLKHMQRGFHPIQEYVQISPI